MSRVLVVDDDAVIRAYRKISLEAHGYAVQEAKDGHEALTLYAEFPAER